jgi:hypothetical protein
MMHHGVLQRTETQELRIGVTVTIQIMFSTASVVTAQSISNTTDGVKITFKTGKK